MGGVTVFRFLSYVQDGHVARITIRRPEVLNALHDDAHLELNAAWSKVEADDSVWVAILTGAGDKAFCVGADLKHASAGSPQVYWVLPKPGGFGGLTERFSLTKPVIAAVNGYALGGGFEMVLSCDIVVAAEHARFGLPEPRVGMMACDGGVHRLVRQLPIKIAMGMLLTGQQITSAEAHAWGLVNEVVPGEHVLDAAERWASKILECAPLSIRATKEAALGGLHLPLSDAINRRYAGMLRWMAAEDTRDGPRAFVEKRTPAWVGR
jgi:dehydration protein DpgD